MRHTILLLAPMPLVGCGTRTVQVPEPTSESPRPTVAFVRGENFRVPAPAFPKTPAPPQAFVDKTATIPADFMAEVAGPGEIDQQFPFPQDLEKAKTLRNLKKQWARENTLAVFDRHGNTNAAWAGKARKAMEAYARREARHVAHLDGIEQQEFVAAVGEAADAGADDLLIQYWKVRFVGQARAAQSWKKFPLQEVVAGHRAVMQRLPESKYPAQMKLHVAASVWHWLVAARKNGLEVADEEIDEAKKCCWEQVIEAAASPNPFDRRNVFHAVRALLLQHGEAKADGGEAFWQATKKRLEDGQADAWTRHVVEGDFLIRFAWHARGSGLAGTVTPQGWKLFAERLAEAAEHLEEAYRIDPSLPDPAALMVSVAMGTGLERPEMETWFRRAMTADPDNYDAARAKMTYLLPKWHGSLEGSVEFADQCLRTGNYYSRLPLLVLLGMAELQKCNPRALGPGLKHPLLWTRIQAAFEGTLALDPEDHEMRTLYARNSGEVQRWPIAHEQFERLGENAVSKYFASREELEMRRTMSRRLGTGKK